jgi:alpha-mannosidase
MKERKRNTRISRILLWTLVLPVTAALLAACTVSMESPEQAAGEPAESGEPTKEGEVTKDAVTEVLSALKTATDSSLQDWEVRIESGTTPETVDQRPWSRVRLSHYTKDYRVRYKRTIVIPGVFAGTKIDGGRAELLLSINGPSDYWGEVLVNGESRGKIPARDPKTLAVEISPILLAENAAAGSKFEVEIALFNSLTYPPQEFLDTSMSISLRSARFVLEKAEEMKKRLEEFAVNIDAGNTLLRPWKPDPGSKRVFHPEPVDRSKIGVRERRQLRDVLLQAAAEFDLQALASGETPRLNASMERVLERLKPVSEFAKTFTVYLVGNAHIDLAWLWRTSESVQISANTFQSAINNMEEFPDMVYAQSQAQTYEWVEKDRPQLFDKIQDTVKAGNWDVVGGMWAEPDCNVPSGESFIRQVLFGQRYFREKFGKTAWLGWNPDSFGYNWNMPQMYSKAGIKAFITQKIHWNDTTAFPYNLFWWEAPDGSRILTYFPPGSYTERVDPDRLVEQVMQFEYGTGFREVLVLFGIGNHGGGPNREMLLRAEMLKRQPVYPKVEYIRAHDYIDLLMQRDLSDLPVWRDELYLEQHRGTLTTQSETKRNNRTCESLLETAEKVAGAAALLGKEYPKSDLDRAWKIVLLNQFHDILPGSGITPVYRDADETYALAKKMARRVIDDSLNAIAAEAALPQSGWRNLIVFNPLSWNRTGVVKITLPLDAPAALTVKDADGRRLLSQIAPTENGLDRELLFIAADVPPVGYKLFTVAAEASTESNSDLRAQGYRIENGFLRVDVDPKTGNLSSVFDKKNNKEILANESQGNALQLFENIPDYWDAWNIGYTDKSWTIDKADSVELLERGPVRAVIRVKKSFIGLSKANRAPTEGFPSSFFVQDITLYAGSSTLDVTLRTDWWEDHTLLKVAFPLAVSSNTATYEIPYAVVTRPTTRETPWEKARFEVAVHRWADLTADGYGVSLLNDGKYGMDINVNLVRLTIHTSPIWPDPYADRGRHVCTYSLYPHKDGWRNALTPRKALELNLPLAAGFVEAGGGDLPSSTAFAQVDKNNVVLSCFKRAEESDDLVLRLVETSGEKTEVTVELHSPVSQASLVDLLENEISALQIEDGKIRLEMNPYEIKTVKVMF